tara:strand:- start:59 stop:1192 length:1134 start_codon:yes stop_codon:yes gene_type:complete
MSTLNDAKFTLIPSGYKSTKVYSVKPTNGDGDFTFSRNGDASRLNPGLNIEQVSANVPRINHYSGGCPSLLLENEAQNLITYSEDFSQWTTNDNAVVIDNNAISPDGNLNASLFTFDGTTNGRVEISTTVTNGSTLIYSIYLKNNNLSDTSQVWIGLDTTSQGEYVTITNEWQRFTTTQTANSSTELPMVKTDETGSIYAWGAQLEINNLTSYIKSNTGSPTTRQKDQCYDAGNSDLFNITEGSYFIDIKPFSNSSFYNISLSDGSANNRISWQFQNNNTQVRVRIVSGSTPVMNEPESVNFGSRNKLCLTFKDNEFKTYINGSLVNTQTSGNIPTSLDRLSFAVYNTTGNFFEGEVYSVKIYDYLLTETQAIELTT